VIPAILLVSLLAGCSSLSSYDESLPLQPPEQFSHQGGEQSVSAQWWHDFSDPSLALLIEQALADNFSLRAAWARLRQSDAVAEREGAARLPSLDLKGSFSRQDSNESDGESSRQFGFHAAYELDLWGRVKASAEASALDAKASQADLQIAALSLSVTLANTWYQLVEQRSQLKLIATQLELNRQLLKLVEARFRMGQVKASDVYRQRQLLAQTEGEEIQAGTQLGILEQQLAILVGRTPGAASLPRNSDLPLLAPLPATGLPADLLQRRPDLKASLLRLQAADARAAAAVAARYPRLDLTAALTTPGASGGVFDNWLGNIAAQLTLPLFDGGKRRAEVERTQAVVEESLNDYAQVLLEALAEVETALIAESGQRQYLATIDAQLKYLDAVATQERQRYFQGDADYLSVLDALRSRQALERQQLKARRELISDRIALVSSLAGGWTMIPKDDTQ
jgi:NodT family efflux transporter outer membrane factor (OMF) lipoprotein